MSRSTKQQKIIEAQDGVLDEIIVKLDQTKHTAQNINTELKTQEPLIDDLGENIGNTTNNIVNNTRKIKNLIKNDNFCQKIMFIAFLIVIIIVLLFIIIYL